MVPKGATSFSVRLQRGADVDNSDVHLDVSARFGNSALVVLNARRSAVWGKEEPGRSLSIPVAIPFVLVLTASLDCFEVEIVGLANESFKSRDGLPISSVTHLAIEGCLSLRAIHIPVENMPRNLRLSIPGRVKVGDMVFIRGTPSIEAQSFLINIQSGPGKFDDVMLNFNPRFPEKEVTVNSRQDDAWDTPEKASNFPFQASKSFDLCIVSSPLRFETWVDGQEFKSLTHRMDMTNASTLFIEGDLLCENILVDSPPVVTFPVEWSDGLKLNLSTPRASAFNPELPLMLRITGGLEKNCIILLSGEVMKEPTGFHMNVQYDSFEDSDIALQYSHQWQGSNKDPLISLNSREDDTWGKEVKITNDKLTLSPGMHFDIAIQYTGEQFRVSANGLHQGDFPMAFEDVRPDHITLTGDILVQRLLVV